MRNSGLTNEIVASMTWFGSVGQQHVRTGSHVGSGSHRYGRHGFRSLRCTFSDIDPELFGEAAKFDGHFGQIVGRFLRLLSC